MSSQPCSLVGSSVHITKTVSLWVRYQARRTKSPFYQQADGVGQGLLSAGDLGPNESTAALISVSAMDPLFDDGPLLHRDSQASFKNRKDPVPLATDAPSTLSQAENQPHPCPLTKNYRPPTSDLRPPVSSPSPRALRAVVEVAPLHYFIKKRQDAASTAPLALRHAPFPIND